LVRAQSIDHLPYLLFHGQAPVIADDLPRVMGREWWLSLTAATGKHFVWLDHQPGRYLCGGHRLAE
jgi:hypothetical protein